MLAQQEVSHLCVNIYHWNPTLISRSLWTDCKGAVVQSSMLGRFFTKQIAPFHYTHLQMHKNGLGKKNTAVYFAYGWMFLWQEKGEIIFTCWGNVIFHRQLWFLSQNSFLCRHSITITFTSMFLYFISCRRLDFIESLSFPLKIKQRYWKIRKI